MEKEKIQIDLLRLYFLKLGMTKKFVQQADNILHEGFNSILEVQGSVFLDEPELHDIRLEVVVSSIMSRIEKELQLFRIGNYQSVPDLHQFLEYTKKSLTELYGKLDVLDALTAAFKMVAEKTPESRNLDLKIREDWFDIYKDIIGMYTVTPLLEYNLNSKDSLGFFHVHTRGTEPSKVDIDKNKLLKTPDLVISAVEDYKTSGVRMYLVHSGSFETLYSGPLESTRTIEF